MGKALQVRVSAVTWNEDLVPELWPRLAELAFSVPLRHERRGVLEMVRALGDGMQFMDWSPERRAALGPGVEKALDTQRRLQSALENWNPREANSLSEELELVLDDLEMVFR